MFALLRQHAIIIFNRNSGQFVQLLLLSYAPVLKVTVAGEICGYHGEAGNDKQRFDKPIVLTFVSSAVTEQLQIDYLFTLYYFVFN